MQTRVYVCFSKQDPKLRIHIPSSVDTGQASHEHLCQYIYRFWALIPVYIMFSWRLQRLDDYDNYDDYDEYVNYDDYDNYDNYDN